MVKRIVSKNRRIHAADDWLFGEPTLTYSGNSIAYWSRGVVSPRLQKSSTGWQACLHGRVQSGDDWAAVYVPVNELLVRDFDSAQWSYYMSGNETMGVNMVIWVHDPADFDKRAEITQLGGHSGLEKASGWNAHELDTTVTQFFFYGEGTTYTELTAGTQYTWNQFKADNLFKNWTIYRISLEYGWEASGTFDQVWLADLKLNEIMIPLKPRSDADLTPVHTYYTGSSDITTGYGTVAPKTPFQLLSVSLHLDANPGTAAAFVIQVLRDNDKHATYYDTVIHTSDMYVPSTATSRHVIFGEGYEFAENDVIDILWDGNAKNYGLVITWKPL